MQRILDSCQCLDARLQRPQIGKDGPQLQSQAGTVTWVRAKWCQQSSQMTPLQFAQHVRPCFQLGSRIKITGSQNPSPVIRNSMAR
jgi:hypothetical protein